MNGVTYVPGVNHRRSIRLPAYDYSQAGAYFVTICTYTRGCILGDPLIGRMLTRIWARTAGRGRFPNEGDFVVMPNHVHGIVWIAQSAAVGANRPRLRESLSQTDSAMPADDSLVSVDGSTLRVGPSPVSRRVERGSLGALVGSFKANATIAVNKIRGTVDASVWQRNYYERIIRNDDELARIRQYIVDNPAKWAEDKNNPRNW